MKQGQATADGLADGSTVISLWDPTVPEGMDEPNFFWTDAQILLLTGDMRDQLRRVLSWVRATGVLTVDPPFVNPNVSLLSGNVLAGAVIIPVVDASVFSLGEARIWDLAPNAETVTIINVNTVLNQLTIAAPGLVNPYTVADNAAISMSPRITDGTYFLLECSRKQTSGAVVLVSGQTVKVSGEVVHISGQHIYQESGAVVLVSGQTVIAKVSGEVVKISGEVVQISGQHIYQESGAVVLISGETVIAKVSGEVVQISGQSLIAGVSGETVIAKVSGEVVKISGETIIGKVSGEVAKISGEAVKVSGETVIGKISGETLRSLISGDAVKVSGETVIGKVSGEAVKVSGETVLGKVSGETVIAKISGEIVVAKISGETILTSVSGNVVKVSGEVVKISGETVIAKVSGEAVSVSGNVLAIEVPTEVKTGLIRIVTAASGGAVLHSGAVLSLKLKALSGNSGDIYVGGETNRPYSGFGFVLEPGEAEAMDIDDFKRVYVVATVSGDMVCFDGVR